MNNRIFFIDPILQQKSHMESSTQNHMDISNREDYPLRKYRTIILIIPWVQYTRQTTIKDHQSKRKNDNIKYQPWDYPPHYCRERKKKTMECCHNRLPKRKKAISNPRVFRITAFSKGTQALYNSYNVATCIPSACIIQSSFFLRRN